MKELSLFELINGAVFDDSTNEYPTRVYSWSGMVGLHLQSESSTYFGYVVEGPVSIHTPFGHYHLNEGMYFSMPSTGFVRGGKGMLVERIGHRGMFSIGGPIENSGRLRYIDGCTDSLLIPPVRRGDPCLNALYFPPGTNQTRHTHPSMMAGVVIAGRGECVTPKGAVSLSPGSLFILHPEGLHSFRTDTDRNMVVIVYHPETDFGPDDQFHPMINRTIVDGVSASHIQSIRTPEQTR